jgi:hypothetical protein
MITTYSCDNLSILDENYEKQDINSAPIKMTLRQSNNSNFDISNFFSSCINHETKLCDIKCFKINFKSTSFIKDDLDFYQVKSTILVTKRGILKIPSMKEDDSNPTKRVQSFLEDKESNANSPFMAGQTSCFLNYSNIQQSQELEFNLEEKKKIVQEWNIFNTIRKTDRFEYNMKSKSLTRVCLLFLCVKILFLTIFFLEIITKFKSSYISKLSRTNFQLIYHADLNYMDN